MTNTDAYRGVWGKPSLVGREVAIDGNINHIRDTFDRVYASGCESKSNDETISANNQKQTVQRVCAEIVKEEWGVHRGSVLCTFAQRLTATCVRE